MKPALRNLKKRLDYTANGGATIIGCKKSITKSHGSAKANTIAAAIAQVKRVHKANLNEKITKAIQAIDWENLGEKSTKE